MHTALSILNTSSASSVLHVDPARFYNHLYGLLGRMAGVGVDGLLAKSATQGASSSSLMQYTWAQTPAALAAQTLAKREALLKNGKKGENDDDEVGSGTTLPKRHSGIPLEETERFTDVILACLDMLIVSRKREVSMTRVLAYVKRLASLSVAVVRLTVFLIPL